MSETLHRKVLLSNIELYHKEARVYDQIHFDIWNSKEQERISHVFERTTSLIDDNSGKALTDGIRGLCGGYLKGNVLNPEE